MLNFKKNKINTLLKNTTEPKLLQTAFEFAKHSYEGKKRIFQESYLAHVLDVAEILKNMGLDPQTVAASLLHDVVDDLPLSAQKIQLEEIKKKFGEEIKFLVERTSELGKIRHPLAINFEKKPQITDEKFENIIKMFLAEAKDIRAVLIELVSRLDNLSHLYNLPEEQQKIFALETLKIYVPIAERLGIWEVKSKLEDIAFSYLFPQKYEWIKTYIKKEGEERRKYLKLFAKKLRKILKKERVEIVGIHWREKTYWSTYQKLLKKNMDIEKIHDLLALRIIVNGINNCYKTLGIIHKYYTPLEEEIDNYIAKPKPNGYRALHTTVFSEKGQIAEIQIQTPEMQKEAEYGVCAHWAYKEKVDLMENKEQFELTKEIPQFWKNFKIDFFTNKVFVFTPRGDVIELPKDSTPVDFAYAIHSEIGNHCEAAKVNGKIVNLSQPLKNGDIVEIIVNKKRWPSLDWLRFVKSNLAISQIKKSTAKNFLLFKIPYLEKIPYFIKRKLFEVSEKIEKKEIKKRELKEIYIAGEKGILVTKAKCCRPEPTDEVAAYLSKYRAAVLHKKNCKNLQKLVKKFPEKVVEARWE